MTFRTERDPLGELNVPADAYYGVQTARAVENFPISGLRAPADLVTATILVKKAAAEANRDLGRLDADVARAIVARRRRDSRRPASRSVRRRRLPGRRRHLAQHERERGAGQPRRRSCSAKPRGTYKRVHPNDHVNMGQSTNDVFPTATRLALLLGTAPLVRAATRPRRGARSESRRSSRTS